MLERTQQNPSKERPTIEGYPKDDYMDDYMEVITENGIDYGVCEIEGKRLNQEDSIKISSSDGVKILKTMRDEDIKAGYHAAFNKIQNTPEIVPLKGDGIGSTCCSVTAWINESDDPDSGELAIWTANLGDSAAYLVIIDEENSSYRTEPLNSLHNPAEKKEYERLKKIKTRDGRIAADLIAFGRLGGGVAVSRAFGDFNFEENGLSHIPNVKKYTPRLKRGEIAYIVCGCDGLVEAGQKTKDLGKIVFENKDKSLDKIAEAMVAGAYQGGSTDNISVGIFKVGINPGSITVADGHGGTYAGFEPELQKYSASILSKNICDNFYPTLEQQMQVCKEDPDCGQKVLEAIPDTDEDKSVYSDLLTPFSKFLEYYSQTLRDPDVQAFEQDYRKLKNDTERNEAEKDFISRVRGKADDEDPQACLALGVFYTLRNELATAEGFLQKILKHESYDNDAYQLLAYIYKSQEKPGALPNKDLDHHNIKALAYFLSSPRSRRGLRYDDRTFPGEIHETLNDISQTTARDIRVKLGNPSATYGASATLTYKVIRCQFDMDLISADEYQKHLEDLLNNSDDSDFKDKVLFQLARASLTLAKNQKDSSYIANAKLYVNEINTEQLKELKLETKLKKVAALKELLLNPNKLHTTTTTSYLETVKENARESMKIYGTIGQVLGIAAGNVFDFFTAGLGKVVHGLISKPRSKNSFSSYLNSGFGWCAGKGLELLGKGLGGLIGAIQGTGAFLAQQALSGDNTNQKSVISVEDCLSYTDDEFKKDESSNKNRLFNLSTYSQLSFHGSSHKKVDEKGKGKDILVSGAPHPLKNKVKKELREIEPLLPEETRSSKLAHGTSAQG